MHVAGGDPNVAVEEVLGVHFVNELVPGGWSKFFFFFWGLGARWTS